MVCLSVCLSSITRWVRAWRTIWRRGPSILAQLRSSSWSRRVAIVGPPLPLVPYVPSLTPSHHCNSVRLMAASRSPADSPQDATARIFEKILAVEKSKGNSPFLATGQGLDSIALPKMQLSCIKSVMQLSCKNVALKKTKTCNRVSVAQSNCTPCQRPTNRVNFYPDGIDKRR